MQTVARRKIDDYDTTRLCVVCCVLCAVCAWRDCMRSKNNRDDVAVWPLNKRHENPKKKTEIFLFVFRAFAHDSTLTQVTHNGMAHHQQQQHQCQTKNISNKQHENDET